MRGKGTTIVKLNLISVMHGQSYTSSTSKRNRLYSKLKEEKKKKEEEREMITTLKIAKLF
jgi:hypothetical protein